jgi:protein-S-isoprenylcysteine O-methyltransferase Ste14
MRSLELKIPPVVIVLLLGAAMWTASRWWPGLRVDPPLRGVLAAGLILTGLGIALAGVISFRRAGTTVNPLQPAASSRLVVSGVYRRTRNPMYLGMLLLLLGWAVWLAHPVALVLAVTFVPVMNRLQILPEERSLAAMFGATFIAYQSSVRRWL